MRQLILTLIVSQCLIVFHNQINAQGTWTQKADVGTFGRLNAVGFSIGTKGYIGTGRYHPFAYPYPDSLLRDFWEWDQTTNAWTQKADFAGTARLYSIGFSIGTKGYIGLGADTTGWAKDMWEWDQATNIWTQKANFGGTGRYFPVSFSIGSKGYFGTGSLTLTQGLDDFWEFDPATNIWSQKANFAGGIRQEAIGFSIGSKGYIGVGRDYQGGNTYNDLWEWDQTTNTWSQKSNYGGIPKYNSAAFSINTKGYIATGLSDTTYYLNDFWEWDKSTNIWGQKATFSGVGRCEAVGFSIGNKGYVGTGSNEFWIGYKDFWEYDPNGNGINEYKNPISISIFPNPFYAQTTMQTNNLLLNATLTVYNLYGQAVKEIKNISGHTVTLFRDNLPSGLYFVRLTEEGKTLATDKLVITD
ncbi:MAG: T9SS type A sorting domain-containing protein [Bacteroidetes bacterium]|nr:T9SS type A sorting domain-containing protein [Bacteroidota bacterium]